MTTETTSMFAERTLSDVCRKAAVMAEKARDLPFIPYTVQDSAWQEAPMDGIAWWTNGFYPALFWQLFSATGDGRWRAEALRAQTILDRAFLDFEHLHHDVGFMWRLSSGFQYDLEGGEEPLRRTLYAAHLLMGRYNPNGFFRAWNMDRTGWAIIDCMMNLPILYFATEHTGDPRFALAARNHADTVLRHFIRENGASEHIVIFDPLDGHVMEKPGGQGYAPGSEWTRGQGWALYGLSLAGRHLKDRKYTDAAVRVADHVLERMGAQSLCPVDFLSPEEPKFQDDCATGILACGLLDLAEQTGKSAYAQEAETMLRALCTCHADWGEESPAILRHCTGSWHGERDREIPMIYGDYYLVEGLLRLAGKLKLRW